MAANTPGTLLNMYEVCCVLCAAKLKESTSRINVRGRSEFPIEEELRKLPIAVPIDDKSRICKLCLKKLRKQKSLRDSLQESAEAIVRTFTKASESDSGSLPSTFVPLHTCTPKKSIKAATPNNSSLPVVNLSQTSSTCSKNPKQTEPKEPGVVVSSSSKNCLILVFSKSVMLLQVDF